ncbi:cAMP-binding protein-catabolite gene activator and regulatory subunit of cAMP-dependent protein kinase [Magnetospirillum sp. XM-1]|uniref:Crp/Fnr family transcriptional regulator n=1 Tax=Magnetospirillum sp. XM-1 TaxID=1663591 RepID=UPI00073DD163|nr:Crp/Fnr family transcriptional regulator [Magnetospirillum sp. XM-1]CUW41084.1 cAMP-binding protein-catabolite gene activator and regulatory subunit of cAMP-dependent protein kinase [Magnetospirillum sp. XM-1]
MRLEDAMTCAGKGAPPPVFGDWPRRRPERLAKDKLAQVPPFSRMPPDLLADLAAEADVLHLTETTVLFQAQQPADALYVVLRGTVVLLGPDGVIVDGIGAPAILGAADLFTGRHMFTAEALAGPVVVRIPRAAMMSALERDGALANAFLGLIAAAGQSMAEALMAQRCLTGVQRLAAFLLEKADEAGAEGAFVLDIPKKAIAGQLGMTPAHFARSLTRLTEAGVERRNRNTIILNDISALRRLLEGELGVATQDGSTAQHKQRAAYMSFRGHS